MKKGLWNNQKTLFYKLGLIFDHRKEKFSFTAG